MIEGEVDAAMAASGPDLTYHNPMLRDMPPLRHPADAIRQLIGVTREAFPDMDHGIHAVIAEADLVAVLYTWSGTNLGPLAGLAPTGRRVRATVAIVCRVADGRIVEQWDIDDRLYVIQQLGLTPMAGAAAS